MDTVTLVRSAIRGLFAAAGDLQAGLRGLLARDDDYAAAGKPACDYDDAAARQALVDALARDARAVLAALDGQELPALLAQAAALLASYLGQLPVDGLPAVLLEQAAGAAEGAGSEESPVGGHGAGCADSTSGTPPSRGPGCGHLVPTEWRPGGRAAPPGP
jgi:hypothetical protein